MPDHSRRLHLGVCFGGRSVEHEISIITALELISAVDTRKFCVTPIYISPQGKWYVGLELLDKNFYRNLSENLEHVTQVTLFPEPRGGQLHVLKAGRHPEACPLNLDVFLLANHGAYVEDGCLQGLLEMAEMPYTCTGVWASALSMHKYGMKMFLKAHDIPTLPSVLISHQDYLQEGVSVLDRIEQTPGLEHPVRFVKPNNLGSSIGIQKTSDRQSLGAALFSVFNLDEHALVEPYLDPMIELNIAVRYARGTFEASVVEQPKKTTEALSYEDKYLRGGKKRSGQGMASLAREIDPPSVDPSIKASVQSYALKAAKLLDLRGIVRFDFMLSLTDQQIYFNELNTLPGSLAHYLWKERPWCCYYSQLIEDLVAAAQERHAWRRSRYTPVVFQALFA